MSNASAFDMSALDNRIKDLVAYARERDGEDRTVLFRNLVDLFLIGKAPQANPTRSQLLDVIEALVPHVDTDSRRTAADLIANMATPPMDLALRLCRDRTSIVVNLLTHVVFDEDDLIELIEQTGREHHQVIASREDLSANIWIALARAAPSAPPFDHQSTLALWSEDLGITGTTPASKAPATENQPLKSATVTPIHSPQRPPKKNMSPSIRILRTDNDLVARPDQKKNTDAPATKNGPTNTPTGTPGSLETAQQIPGPASPQEPSASITAEPSAKARDPGPSGWAWASDRNGIIRSLSPNGSELLAYSLPASNASVLDLLSLNNKLGHPVARAFQRRSAIHDAPILLQYLQDGKQHWTLQATPIFSAGGGIFEGYEGALMPVVTGQSDVGILQSEDEACALFLDEVTVAAAGGTRNAPLSFTEESANFLPNEPAAFINLQSQPKPGAVAKGRTAEVEQATKDTLEHIAANLNTPTVSHANSATPAEEAMPQSIISDTASDLIKDALQDMFKSEDKPAKSHKKTAPNASSPEPAPLPEGINSNSSAHIQATLELLGEALARLTDHSKTHSEPQVRLQAEIASACLRSLKDQLG
ncbi:MAG: hypothetical protein COB37_00520 [Kordiimonadales bacterium]|nr:MAG: hypothetical protein COB37_00520 [Kordiimonadales bacterium]